MQTVPYMMAVGNIPAIFQKIQTAGTPPRFTHEFLKTNLGFTASGDRGVIAVLKNMGFLTDDGAPTDRYNQFRAGGKKAKQLIAIGLKEGWPAIFLSDQQAYQRTQDELKGMFSATTGKGDAVAQKMAATFKALSEIADFSEVDQPELTGLDSLVQEAESVMDNDSTPGVSRTDSGAPSLSGLNLRHDIHVHLPPTSDVAVYKAIFRALKDELSD